jgi:hypothetical protein
MSSRKRHNAILGFYRIPIFPQRADVSKVTQKRSVPCCSYDNVIDAAENGKAYFYRPIPLEMS